jgi:hypothetical protein
MTKNELNPNDEARNSAEVVMRLVRFGIRHSSFAISTNRVRS